MHTEIPSGSTTEILTKAIFTHNWKIHFNLLKTLSNT